MTPRRGGLLSGPAYRSSSVRGGCCREIWSSEVDVPGMSTMELVERRADDGEEEPFGLIKFLVSTFRTRAFSVGCVKASLY